MVVLRRRVSPAPAVDVGVPEARAAVLLDARPDRGGRTLNGRLAARLAVKRATLYAYVIRGLMSRTRVDGSRTSYFSSDEIDRWTRGARRPERASGDHPACSPRARPHGCRSLPLILLRCRRWGSSPHELGANTIRGPQGRLACVPQVQPSRALTAGRLWNRGSMAPRCNSLTLTELRSSEGGLCNARRVPRARLRSSPADLEHCLIHGRLSIGRCYRRRRHAVSWRESTG